MKKVVRYFIFTLLSIAILSGCSVWGINGSNKEAIKKQSSSLGPVLSNFSFAQLDGRIAYLTIKTNEVVFCDEQRKKEEFVELPQNRQCLEITAGKDYFYVYCSNKDETDGYLRIYDKDTKLVNEISLPFKRVCVKNGIVFGYYDETADFFSWDSNIANSHIEATHYINEDKFLDKFPDKIVDWIEIKGTEKVNIENLQFYCCLPDYYHGTKYYSDRKPLSILNQIDYVRYCDGKLASEEYDTNISPRLSQIYSMMRKREENFLIHSFEIDDTIYGICNVYSEQGDLLTLYTQNLKYSFSFRYAEKEDKLYKVHEYEDMELIYEDDKNCLYHRKDGVYCKNLETEKQRKVFDYNGEIGVTLIEGYVKFQEREVHYDDDLMDKQEIKKVW